MKRGLEKLLLSLSAAIFLQSSSCWIYTQPIPKEPTEQYCEKKPEEFGSTENKLEYLIKSYGLNTESQITKNDIEYVLYTTKPARDIIDKEQFDIAKKKFDIKQFKGFVMNNFIEGIDYYSKNFPTPIKKVHIVITDFGKARDKNSTYTWMNTSIIHTDVRRWHKYWIYDNSLMAKVIAAHEFTHIQNYSLDRNETKVGKEYAAITVECLAYINFAGKEKFKKAYRGKMIGIVPRPDAIKYDQPENRVRRSVIRNLFIGTMDGKYATIEKDSMVALNNLGKCALKEPTNGEDGFNLALNAAGFTYDKKPLTLKVLRDETEKEIIEWYAERGIKL